MKQLHPKQLDATRSSTAASPLTASHWLAPALRAVVLLGGSVRPTQFNSAIGRPILDLPVDDHHTIIDYWANQAETLASALNLERLVVRVIVNQHNDAPSTDAEHPHVAVHVEHDAAAFRGTAGVLRDLAQIYNDDDFLLVANGAQILTQPIGLLTRDIAEPQADFAIVSHDDGIPSGLMLIRCAALRNIAEVGFVDMKEQALPQIAQNHHVKVIQREHATGLPIRTLPDYIRALRWHHRSLAGATRIAGPFSEGWEASFAIVEPGASVALDARIHDSVVLRDGVAQAGTVLVNSIVCPNGRVLRNQTAVDSIVSPQRRIRNGGAPS